MKDLLDIVAQVTRLLEDTPGAASVLDALRTGKVSPEEAMAKLADIALSAGHGEALVAASGRLQKAAHGQAGAPVTLTHDNGMSMLNPVMEAALIERASIDGDVPEARSGSIPEGGSPAVPVLTTALDPVVVGIQLERASQEVAEEIRLLVESHGSTCSRILEKISVEAKIMDLDEKHAMEAAKKSLPAVPVGVAGYRAGRVPTLRRTNTVEMAALVDLTDAQRRLYTYRAVATTQGRVSLTGVIQSGIIDYLRAHSINVVAGDPAPETSVTTKWVVEVWGADDMADGFNPVLTAIHSMSIDVMEHLTAHPENLIRVNPYHGIADRRFGWTLVAGPKERTT